MEPETIEDIDDTPLGQEWGSLIDTPSNEAQETNPVHIILHALMGHSIPQTLRVMGQIRISLVAILIDSGIAHNFLQNRVSKQLGLMAEPTHSFKVLVGNG